MNSEMGLNIQDQVSNHQEMVMKLPNGRDASDTPLIMYMQNESNNFEVTNNTDDNRANISSHPSIKVKNLELLTQHGETNGKHNSQDGIRNNSEKESQDYLNTNFGIEPNSRVYAVVLQHPIDLYDQMENSTNENVLCPYCFKQFSNKADCESHVKLHMSDTSKSSNANVDQNGSAASHGKPFACEYCGRGFSRKDNMVRHVRTHEKQYSCNCEFCGKQFYRNSHLMAHIRAHNKERPFNCQFCNKQFSRKDVLRKHIRRTHASEDMSNRFHSNINISTDTRIEKSYSQLVPAIQEPDSPNVSYLENMSIVNEDEHGNSEIHTNYNGDINSSINGHAESDENDCSELNEGNDISCVEYLKIDYHTEPNDKPIMETEVQPENVIEQQPSVADILGQEDLICPYCHKQFELTSHVQMHIKLHTLNLLRPYAGEIENKPCNNKSCTNPYAKPSSGNKRYVCPECSKVFTRNDHLKVHIMAVHEQVKPFVCQYCNKSFARKDHLIRHERSHTKEKPYCCHYCNTWFTQSGSLVIHVRTKHPDG